MAKKKEPVTNINLSVDRITKKIYTEQEQRLLDQITMEILAAFEKDLAEGKKHLKNIRECSQGLLDMKTDINKVSKNVLKVDSVLEKISSAIEYKEKHEEKLNLLEKLVFNNSSENTNLSHEIHAFSKEIKNKIISIEDMLKLHFDVPSKKFDQLSSMIKYFALIMIFLMSCTLVKLLAYS